MKKFSRLKLGVIFVFSIFVLNIIFTSDILADENAVKSTIDETEQASLDKQTKEEALKTINEIMEQIRQNISSITKKISSTKTRNEYGTYPAVRLNIDTPMFGLSSVANKKLRITKDVSAIDYASGYSIKDVARKNIVKVPSFSVGSVVVLTRDIKINENITLSDANTSLLLSMQYLKQSKDVDDFVDNEINKTFVGYITKEKSTKITDLSNRLNLIENSLSDLDEKVTALYLINKDNQEYVKNIETYTNMYTKIALLKENIKEVLISDENLKNIEKETLLEEASLIDLKTNIEKNYSDVITEYDISSLINNLKNDATTKKDEIKKYIDDSTVTTEQNGQKSTNKVYDVTSTETVDYMNNVISNLDQKLVKYVPNQNTSNLPEEAVNKAEVISAGIGEITKDERESLLKEVVKLYREYNLKENDFYLTNINSYLLNSTSKISSIIKISDENLVPPLKYMYLELPNKLDKYNKENNTNFIAEVKKVTLNLKEEIKTSNKFDSQVNTVYNKVNNDETEEKTRE